MAYKGRNLVGLGDCDCLNVSYVPITTAYGYGLWVNPLPYVVSYLVFHIIFREVLEETGYSIAEKIDPNQYSEQTLNDQVNNLTNFY